MAHDDKITFLAQNDQRHVLTWRVEGFSPIGAILTEWPIALPIIRSRVTSQECQEASLGRFCRNEHSPGPPDCCRRFEENAIHSQGARSPSAMCAGRTIGSRSFIAHGGFSELSSSWASYSKRTCPREMERASSVGPQGRARRLVGLVPDPVEGCR